MFERSGYAAGYYPSVDPEGNDRLLVVIKRTFKLDAVEAKCEPLDKVEPILLADEYLGDEDPFKSSVAIESDLAPWKLARDVVFVGKAHAPQGKKVPTFDATLRVGRFAKRVRLFGPRKATWVPPRDPKKKNTPPEPQPPVISEPEPIAEVPLTYENAYGGFATFYPPDPAAFRKAIRKQRKKEEKKAAEKKADEAKKAEEAEKKAVEQKAAALKAKKKQETESVFSSGVKRIEDAPDVELEVEQGSKRFKSAEGTVVLDLAELAEAEARDALEETERVDQKAADEKRRRRDQKDIAADAATLAAQALADTAAGDAERSAKAKAARALDSEGTRTIDLSELGEELDSPEDDDEDWVEVEKRRRDEFYASLGLDPEGEVEWVEGDFPRIPCPTNFVGKGFALGNSKESLDGLSLPLIEDPDAPLTPEQLPVDPTTLHLGLVPRPGGLGVIHRAWQPRAALAGFFPRDLGRMQHEMDKQIADLDPNDPDDEQIIRACIERQPPRLDPRVHNGAAFQIPELWGDEDVFLENLDKSGNTFFKLPGRTPLVRFDRGKGWEKVEVILDTLVIDREKDRVHLVWRGTLPFTGPAEMEHWSRVDIDVQDFSVVEWRDREESLALGRRKVRGEALKLGVDEISAEEAALFDDRIEQAGIGLHGIKEDKPARDQETRQSDGALLDLRDGDDILLHDDSWVQATIDGALTDEERRAAELARDEVKAVAAKKAALKAKLEALDEKRRLEAEAEAKKKKKKKDEKPKGEGQQGDDDGDDDSPDAAPVDGPPGPKGR